MAREIAKSNQQRMADLVTKQTEEYNNRRIHYKVSNQTVYDELKQVFLHSCFIWPNDQYGLYVLAVRCFPLSNITWKFVSVI